MKKRRLEEAVKTMIEKHDELMEKRGKLISELLKDVMVKNNIKLIKSFISSITWNKEFKMFNIHMVDHLYKGSKYQSFAISSWFSVNINEIDITKSKTFITDTWYNTINKRNIGYIKDNQLFKDIESICNKDSLETFVKDNIETLLDLCNCHLHAKIGIGYILINNEIQNMKCIGDYDRIYETIRFNDFNDVGLHADLYFHNKEIGMEHIIIPMTKDREMLPYQDNNKIFFKKEDIERLIKAQELLKNYFYK